MNLQLIYVVSLELTLVLSLGKGEKVEYNGGYF
jgi:hypothetical protein